MRKNLVSNEIAVVSRSAKWRKALVPLTTLAAAGALAIGSGADFSSQSVNPNSIVAAGSLTQSNSKANAAIFNVNNLKPGDVVNGDVLITNTGSLGAVMSLTEGTVASTFVNAANLQLVVSDGTNTIYSGNFGAMGTKSLGTFASGASKTYRFTVTFAQSADNTEQGKTASATYTWNGAQTSNVTITQGAATPATATNANP